MSQLPHRLGQILIDQDKITRQQLDQALAIQQQHGGAIGHILTELNFISKLDVQKALRKQTWLRPCAACLTFLLAPFSFQCYGYEDNGYDSHAVVESAEQWDNNIRVSSLVNKEVVKVALKMAWQSYQYDDIDLDTTAHWSYSLSRKKDQYSLNMQYKF